MSNSVNLYEFVEFVTFNITVHELIFVLAYGFLLDSILVSSVLRATVRRPTLKPKNPLKKPKKNFKSLKKPRNLRTFFRFLGFYQFWIELRGGLQRPLQTPVGIATNI